MFTFAIFSSKKYDKTYLTKYNSNPNIQLRFFESKLSSETVHLAEGADAVCIFVNDRADQNVLSQLHQYGISIIALRCAGYNNIDIETAQQLNFRICRVPEYSPEAVAEHTVGLMLTLSRKFHKAYNRVREDNFSLEGLMGFNLHKKTVGIIGTGKIGLATIKILLGFGCKILCCDPQENEQALKLGVTYVDKESLFKTSDIISLHCPLIPQTHHLINIEAVNQMKDGVMLINTSRGGLIDSKAVITALKQRRIGYLGLDVYELESSLFFEDLSGHIIDDDIFQRLLTFPNVLITGHQGFFTEEALTTIAKTTIGNVENLLLNNTIEKEFLLFNTNIS